MQRELLESLACVAVAQNLTRRLAVRGLDHVAVNRDGLAVIRIRERARELDGGVQRFRPAGRRADPPGEGVRQPCRGNDAVREGRRRARKWIDQLSSERAEVSRQLLRRWNVCIGIYARRELNRLAEL